MRDGADASAPVIARYCNTLNGEQVFSSGETLYVEFVTDSRKQRQGFAATYRFISEEELKTSSLDVSSSGSAAGDLLLRLETSYASDLTRNSGEWKQEQLQEVVGATNRSVWVGWMPEQK